MLFFQACQETMKLMKNHRPCLLEEALAGYGPLLETLIQLRTRSIIKALKNPYTAAFLIQTFFEAESLLADLKIKQQIELSLTNFVYKNNILIPIPRSVISMNTCLSNSASVLLNNCKILSQHHESVYNILKLGEFKKGDHHYQTILKSGLPVPSGEDSQTLGSLTGLAHELGHCVWESKGIDYSLKGISDSETAAHLFEEYVVASILIEEGLKSYDWHRYQTRIDALNLTLFLLEWEDFQSLASKEGGSSLLATPSRSPLHFSHDLKISPLAMILRDTLCTMPGYQAAYAMASIQRLKLRSQAINNDYLISSIFNVSIKNFATFPPSERHKE